MLNRRQETDVQHQIQRQSHRKSFEIIYRIRPPKDHGAAPAQPLGGRSQRQREEVGTQLAVTLAGEERNRHSKEADDGKRQEDILPLKADRGCGGDHSQPEVNEQAPERRKPLLEGKERPSRTVHLPQGKCHRLPAKAERQVRIPAAGTGGQTV